MSPVTRGASVPDLPLEMWRGLALWFGAYCLMFLIVLGIHIWRGR